MKIQIVVETTTKSFKSNVRDNIDQETVTNMSKFFEKIKEFKYFKMESEDGIMFDFHPNQIVAIGIKGIEN